MKPPPFAYATMRSVEEAAALLAEAGGEAKLLAGGQSLVPMLNFRLVRPAVVVDINRIPGLDYIRDEAGGLVIGALTRHRQIEISAPVAQRLPVLGAAMHHVAHLAIRNRGTLGGSLSHADPAAELPLMAQLLDAEIEAVSRRGKRRIKARDFFRGALTTALKEDEMVTEVTWPALPPGTGWGFEEMSERRGDFALAAAAAAVTIKDGLCHTCRIAVIGSGDGAMRVTPAETLITGCTKDQAPIKEAADAAADAVEPSSDLHASADFRHHLIRSLTARALHGAWRRAEGAWS